MADPVLNVIAGPNGAGKTTFYNEILGPVTRLEFVNADLIAAERWPDAAAEHSYEAARIADDDRSRRIQDRRSFATETVFSHESRIELIREAEEAGYRVTLHVVLAPEALAVARVAERITHGGHHVPEDKVRSQFGRLWRHLRQAIDLADDAYAYDNTKAAEPFRRVAVYMNGRLIGTPQWPPWTPSELREAGR